MHLNFCASVRNEADAAAALEGQDRGTFATWQASSTDVRLTYLSSSDGTPVHLRLAWEVSGEGELIVSIATDLHKNKYSSVEELVASRMYLVQGVVLPGSAAKVPALQPLEGAEAAAGAVEDGGGLRQRIKHRGEPDVSGVVARGVNPATGRYEVRDPSDTLWRSARALVSPRAFLLLAVAAAVLGHAAWFVATLLEHAEGSGDEAAALTVRAHAVAEERVTALSEALTGALAGGHDPGACASAVQGWALDTAQAVAPLQGTFAAGTLQHKLTAVAAVAFAAWLAAMALVFVGSGRATPEDIEEAAKARGVRLSMEDVTARQAAEPWPVVATGRAFYVVLGAAYVLLVASAYVEQSLLWDLGSVQSAFEDRFHAWHSYRGWWLATDAGRHHPGPDHALEPAVLAAQLQLPAASITEECAAAVNAATEEYADGVPHVLLLPLPQPLAAWTRALAAGAWGMLDAWVLPPGVHAHPGALVAAAAAGAGDPDGAPAAAALHRTRLALPTLSFAARGAVALIPLVFFSVVVLSYLRQALLDGLAWASKRKSSSEEGAKGK